MSLQQAVFVALALAFVVLATRRGRVDPILAVLLASVGFGLGSGMSTSQIGKGFGVGFAQSVSTLGLVVVASAILVELADATGASAWLRSRARHWRRRSLPLAAMGLVAGLGSTPAAAFALLSPLRRAVGGEAPRPALALGLAVSASHGLILPAPVLLAAVTILAADWWIALAYGIPVALLAAGAGALVAKAARPDDGALTAAADAVDDPAPHAPGRAAIALALVSAGLVALLITQSLGDIASEPLGGGSNREFLIALGRPLVLLLAGTALMLLLAWHWPADGLSEQGWVGRGFARASRLVLLVGAAGGLAKLAQDTGVAEMNAERLLGWQPVPALALLVPFTIAALLKALQGSSLVAAITAAGMMMELVAPLGLDGPEGRVLAALAIGAGAMTLSHINDGLFWLVADAGRMRAGEGVLRFTLGTLAQGLAALLALILLARCVL